MMMMVVVVMVAALTMTKRGLDLVNVPTDIIGVTLHQEHHQGSVLLRFLT